MLKRLRRRFTSLLMLIISAILIFFYLVIVSILMVTITINMRSALHDFTSEEYVDLYPDIGDEEKYDSSHVFSLNTESVCVVEVKSDGTVVKLELGHARMKSDVLNSAVNDAMTSDSSFGLLSSQMLFFYKNTVTGGVRIAFVNASQYASYLGQLLLRGAVMCLLTIAVIYILSWFMSKIFIRPVERSWEQQKNFIADASHELKTPLTVILANTNILQEHRDSTVNEQFKWIESTHVEAIHMKELVDKMLILAKTENMNSGNMFSYVDMSELATRLCLQFEPVAFEKGIILKSDIDKNVTIYGDQTALNQIMHILIDNSVKYAGVDGEVVFSLKHRQNSVYLSAKNTGEPIPPEDLPHIFERFYRSDKAHTAGNGYGLGLAICKNLAELHNADISVQSDRENGTVFTVRFDDSRRKRKIKKLST